MRRQGLAKCLHSRQDRSDMPRRSQALRYEHQCAWGGIVSRTSFVVACVLLLACTQAAAVNRCKMPDGRTVYQEAPALAPQLPANLCS